MFIYIGSFLDERYKLIEDGSCDPEGEWTEADKKQRYEQSDLVVLLLNLAYIPDSVIMKIPDFKAGWNYKFRELMDEYKADFEKTTGQPWKFHDGELEQQYKDFCRKAAPKAEPWTQEQQEAREAIQKKYSK